jgi:very-short-patch-repair endonuclease/RecA/RadA recombinase
MDPVHEKLEAARRDLLDLGLRNTLLNYRLLKSRGLEIVDEMPDQIYRILVAEGRSMSFLPAPEEVRANGVEDGLYLELATVYSRPEENDEAGGVAARHKDTRLQTPYASVRLQRRLLNTYYAARRSIEEQGVNTLYLALGMLHWYEADSSDILRKAPLILIPVVLTRTNVRSRFKVEYSGEDIDTNLSLQMKLKQELGVDLPSLPNGDEDLDVRAYFRDVASCIGRLPRWEVDPSAVALGFFSFAKLLMYKDLDVENWPEDSKPSKHPILAALLQDGFSEPEPVVGEDSSLDEVVDPGSLFQVVDSDSSQVGAILDVKSGRNLVIQGPPGTGKSQTITNLIANALAEGKKVLFVSEKMAALEVVKRRLDQVGLGDACLELHSNKTNKKAFLEKLQRALDLSRPREENRAREIEELKRTRDRLNEYCKAVNEPIGHSEVSPYQAYGALLRLDEELADVSCPEVDNSQIRTWTQTEYQTRRALTAELQGLLGRMGVPVEHPFWGSRRAVFLPTDREKVLAASRSASESLKALSESARRLSEVLGLPPAENIRAVEELLHFSEHALEAPDLVSVAVEDDAWVRRREEIDQVLRDGERLKALHDEYDPLLLPEAWEQNLLPVRRDLKSYGSRWWRVFSRRYHAVRRVVATLCDGDPPRSTPDRLNLVEVILEAQRCRSHLDQKDGPLGRLYGTAWGGQDSNWPALRSIADYLDSLHRQVAGEELPREIMSYLAGTPDRKALGDLARVVREDLKEHVQCASAAIEEVDLDVGVRFEGQPWSDVPFARQETIFCRWAEEADSLQDMVVWNHLTKRMTEEQLHPIVEVACRWSEAALHLGHLLDRAWFGGLVEDAMRERAPLTAFDGMTHQEIRRRFSELDEHLLQLNRIHLALSHWQGLPRQGEAGQMGVLRREFEKKRRHKPIRRLMTEAGHAIQAVKPVFMMGPLSIATYIPPGSVTFDLVLFDEASQVKPVDALGAILRSEQTVVVGDSRQLPPTAFFEKMGDAEEEQWEDETGDLESILGLFCAQGAPEKMLRWHYRSRHESLIAVSNHEFYDDRLFIFPSPDRSRSRVGLEFHYLPGTAYERGKAVNPEEARIVAEAVMEHARTRPELTLGVAAFSMAQMQVIQDQLELMRLRDPSGEEFFASHAEEPFFVKNLENVQGDERDVIFISVGYGRTREGYVAMNFGPLNRDGGERRLNVLITRARVRCEVFSNLRADDIDTNRTNARGVAAFKTFLHYAETGQLDVPRMAESGEAESPFEQVVADALRKLGHEIHHQVGSAGFFIDLAVVDPKNPGRYLIGIECDGAAYHRARWARDRDRLRQDVLESLGWIIHRVWSTDWFRNPDRELRRTAEAIQAAELELAARDKQIAGLPGPIRRSSETRPIPRIEEEPEEGRQSSPGNGANPYRRARVSVNIGHLELHEVPHARLGEWIKEVVDVESPVHILEVASRIASAAGVKRVGSRIRASIENAARQAAKQKAIRMQGDFLWRKEMKEATVRDRSALPNSSRRMELIAPEEIEAAVLEVVGSSVGIRKENAAAEACRLFGFGRVKKTLRRPVLAVVERMLEAGRLVLNDPYLLLPPTGGDGKKPPRGLR